MKARSQDRGGPTADTFRFGLFELDSWNGELRRDGRRIRLQEQPLRILLLLLARPGDLVTHDELRERLWPEGIFVDFDHGIRTAMNKLRDALADTAENPRFIETIPRRGYRFIAPVSRGHTDPHGAPEPALPRGRRRRLLALLIVSGLALACAVWVGIQTGRRRAAAPGPVTSLAVLPLENVSRQSEQEYFADGMTEALITTLGKIRALRVISQTTAMRYKGSRRTLPEITRELRVDAVLEGSVLRSGDRVRISVQLVRARPEEQVWVGSYERDLRDVLKLQAEVARAVAEEVAGKLTPEAQRRLEAGAVNPPAYEAYLRGEYARKRSAGGMVAGLQHFRDAIAKDRRYAPAYVGLALLNIQQAFGYGPRTISDVLAEAREATRAALQLDPASGEPVSCQAWLNAFADWQWSAADVGFRRAMELSPNSSDAHRLYAWYLSAMSRHEDAVAHSIRARELDPASLVAAYSVGAAFWWSRQWERVAAEAERLEQLDPTFPGAQRLGGAASLQRGFYAKAVQHHERELALCGSASCEWSRAYLGYAFAAAGKKAQALRLLAELRSAAAEKYVSPYLFAIMHTALGETDVALRWLEKAYAERNPMLVFLNVDSLLDPLRSTPRFQDLVRRLQFPD